MSSFSGTSEIYLRDFMDGAPETQISLPSDKSRYLDILARLKSARAATSARDAASIISETFESSEEPYIRAGLLKRDMRLRAYAQLSTLSFQHNGKSIHFQEYRNSLLLIGSTGAWEIRKLQMPPERTADLSFVPNLQFDPDQIRTMPLILSKADAQGISIWD